MAIAFDNSTSGTTTGTSLTIASYEATGSNSFMVVYVRNQGGNIVTGVTYDDIALSEAGSRVAGAGSNYHSMWYLIDPSPGTTADLVVSMSSSAFVGAALSTYTGVKQSAQPDSTANNQNTGTSLTTSTTTVADNCWTVLGADVNGGTISAGTGSTVRETFDGTFSGLFDSNGAITPAGSTSMTVTGTSSVVNTGLIVSMSPVVTQITFSVSDTVNISEAHKEGVGINVNDTVSISENITISKAISFLVQDTINMTESFIGSLSAKVSSTVSITENIVTTIIEKWTKRTKPSTTDFTERTKPSQPEYPPRAKPTINWTKRND